MKVGSTDFGDSTYFWEYRNGRWVAVSKISSSDISGGNYVTRTSTPGWKNVDKVVPTVSSPGKVVNGNSNLAYAQVIIWGENYSGYHTTYCDADGNYNITYKSTSDAIFRITIIHLNVVVNHYKVFTT